MLILRRKKGERIVFFCDGFQISVGINAIRGGGVSLSIDAPREIKVLRQELANGDTTNSQSRLPNPIAGDTPESPDNIDTPGRAENRQGQDAA